MYVDKEKTLEKFEEIYGSETILEIADKHNWKRRSDYQEVMPFLNKPRNVVRVGYVIDTGVFHNRGLRKIFKIHKLQEDCTNILIDTLVSFGLLRVEKYFAPNVINRCLFIYSLLTITEEEMLDYLKLFLSKKGLAKLKGEKSKE